MIQNSIQAFRMTRANKPTAQTVEKTKRSGLLARQQVADTQAQMVNATEGMRRVTNTPAYDPAAKIEEWIKEVEDIRAERTAEVEAAGGNVRPRKRWDGPTGMAGWDGPRGINGGAGGRTDAEEYLGREMSDKEWEMLTRTTYAEATGDPEEQAAVMSVILNRAKDKGFPDSIVDVVNQPNQFQAVTGTKKNPRPSSRFLAFNDEVLNKFEAEVIPRLNNYAETNWLNFTAANPAAYGEGTNVGFIDEVNKSSTSATIGGTLFGTVGK